MTTAQLAGSVAFLRANLARMATDPTFPIEDFAREVRDCRRDLARHDDDRARRNPGVPLGCIADHPDADGRPCGWRLWTDGTNVITCPQCRTDYTPDALLDAHEFALLPAALLILLDWREPTAARRRIENMARRARLTVHDYEPAPAGGRPIPLYRLGEYRATLDQPRSTGEAS